MVYRMYSGKCIGNRPGGRPKERWIDSVIKVRLIERDENLVEAIIVHNMSE